LGAAGKKIHPDRRPYDSTFCGRDKQNRAGYPRFVDKMPPFCANWSESFYYDKFLMIQMQLIHFVPWRKRLPQMYVSQ